MWVEKVKVSVQGRDGQGVHYKCEQGSTFLPLEEAAHGLEILEPGRSQGVERVTASWMVQQIQFEFYS